jgi:hypothetical protein
MGLNDINNLINLLSSILRCVRGQKPQKTPDPDQETNNAQPIG